LIDLQFSPAEEADPIQTITVIVRDIGQIFSSG